MESGGYFMSDSAEEQLMECPACKNGHFVTQMEIDTNRCWYCGGSINKEAKSNGE